MRWDHLFDDLEVQLERELSAQEEDLSVETERMRLARLSLRERLVAVYRGNGARIHLTLTTGDRLVITPTSFGRDWITADVVIGPIRRSCIVPLAAIAGISLSLEQLAASLHSAPDARAAASTLSMSLGLPVVLRTLCRRRRPLDLVVGTTTLHGTIDRVGHDHLDLAVHEPGSERRPAEVTEVRIVPLAHIALVLF
jgi:hypothetical protein